MAHFFGYAVNKEADPKNSTGFFDFGEGTELAKTHKGYLEQNDNMVDWVCTMNDQELSEI